MHLRKNLVRLKIKKRFQPFPLHYTLRAVDALTFHTGVLKPHIKYCKGTKKMPAQNGKRTLALKNVMQRKDRYFL